jgi:hypothetical protein
VPGLHFPTCIRRLPRETSYSGNFESESCSRFFASAMVSSIDFFPVM